MRAGIKKIAVNIFLIKIWGVAEPISLEEHLEASPQ
jgi:hypothetical protein